MSSFEFFSLKLIVFLTIVYFLYRKTRVPDYYADDMKAAKIKDVDFVKSDGKVETKPIDLIW
jgi:hypothetical protein